MNRKTTSCLHGLPRQVLAAGLLTAAASLAQAQAAELSAIWGGGEGDYNATLAYQTSPFWVHDTAHGKLDLSLEASVGEVTGPQGGANHSLRHVGLTPFARWWFTPQSGLEFGVGANLFSGTRIGSRQISTAFQFGDSIGIFHRFAATPWTLGLRFTHYSNADIKRPNPGQDYMQLRVAYSFD